MNSKNVQVEKHILTGETHCNNSMIKQQAIRAVLILLFSGTFNFNGFALNQSVIDSLRQQLVSLKSDTGRIKTYLELGDVYKYANRDSSLHYYRKALKLAGRLQSAKYIALGLKEIGRGFYSQSDYDSALYYFDKALKINKQTGAEKNIADILLDYGNVYIKRGIYDKALEYELSALKLYEKLEDKDGYSGCLNNIGNIYYYQGDYKKALEYYQKSLKIKIELGYKKGMAILLGNIGNLYNELGETDMSLKYNMKSVKIYEELGDQNGIARIYDNMGDTYVLKKDYPLALDYYKKALKLLERTGYKRGIIITLLSIGDVYNRTGQYKKALEYEFRALRISGETGELNSQKMAYEYISRSYKKLRDYKNALLYKEKWFRVHDSIFNVEKANAIADAEARFQSEKQEQQIKLQQADLEKSKAELARVEAVKKRQEIVRDLFIVISLLMLILVVTVSYFYRLKKRDNLLLLEQKKKIAAINEELETKNKELQATLDKLKQTQQQLVQSEKMASLGMLSAGIAHEINNPINFVYAGINSLFRDFEDIEPVIREISMIDPESDNLKEKLQKIERLKEENYFDEAFEAIPQIISDIKVGADRTAEIVKSLRSFSRMDTSKMQSLNVHEGLDTSLLLLKNKYKRNIEIIKNYAPGLPEINCYPGKINQVFLNILSNAIDAIEGEGKIWITTRREDDNVVVSVKDNGCGMSAETKRRIFDPFYTTKDVGHGTGLGMSIAYGIIREHNGKINITSEPGEGTEIVITIPINDEEKT